MLKRLPIDSTSSFFHGVVHEIIRRGVRIGKQASNIGRQVLPFRANIIEKATRHGIKEALDESELLGNNSMVKKMLKRVRVEDNDQSGSTKRMRVNGEDLSYVSRKSRLVQSLLTCHC
ncbi:hypothetical protein V6N13_099334 [Hibiscus sabdariffa]|uniref:Uncharacterized protein n=1 Tax=Hibiscus sabdariffa TaxID=183260 RepID=A0ABR2PZD1_9ROSI